VVVLGVVAPLIRIERLFGLGPFVNPRMSRLDALDNIELLSQELQEDFELALDAKEAGVTLAAEIFVLAPLGTLLVRQLLSFCIFPALLSV
jgi:hypothetical protein